MLAYIQGRPAAELFRRPQRGPSSLVCGGPPPVVLESSARLPRPIGGGALRAPRAGVTAPRRRTVGGDTGAVLTLTENRREILVRLFAGERIAEIAKATGRSRSTIENTLAAIRQQLGARTEYDLMRECLHRRIVSFAEIMRARRDGE